MKMENTSQFLYLANGTREIHDIETTIKPSADDEAEYARLINVVCRPILIALGKIYENVQAYGVNLCTKSTNRITYVVIFLLLPGLGYNKST